MENEKKQESRPCNFSIDHILNRAGQNTCSSIPYNKYPQNNDLNQNQNLDYGQYKTECDNTGFHQYTFQWLNCTRYHPPKLPRHNKKEGAKRQPGSHPRIPFTGVQIEILEKSFKNSPYLCPDEITKLSRQLDLPDTKIKIWFQNRRAREKREREGIFQRSDVKTFTSDR